MTPGAPGILRPAIPLSGILRPAIPLSGVVGSTTNGRLG
ncbi:hypothetical protein ABH925_004306 [Streptacidiphilus sp. EB129]